MLKNPVIYIFITTVFLIVEVQSSICRKQVVTTYLVAETFSYTYMTRAESGESWHTQIKTRSRYAGRVHYITFCCNGSDDYDVEEISSSTCNQTICNSNCTNGYCKHPEICICDNGYTKHNGTCVPLCEGGCKHGTCVAPDTCRCDPGFILVNETCQLVTTLQPTMDYNNSVSLKCRPGYIQSEGICKPFCSYGCGRHMICVAPETCFCDDGWFSKTNKAGEKVCTPQCDASCGDGGICVYPNTCSCYPGYNINYFRQLNIGRAFGPVCKPICQDCKGRDCIGPNQCKFKVLNSTLSLNKTKPFNETTTSNSSYLISNESHHETHSIETPIEKNCTKIDNISSDGILESSIKISRTPQNGISILMSILLNNSNCGKYNVSTNMLEDLNK